MSTLNPTYHIPTQNRQIITAIGPPSNTSLTATAQLGILGEFFKITSADGKDIWCGGQKEFAGGRDSALWRSQDRGASWVDAHTLLPDGYSQDMCAMHAMSPNLIYGGGRRTNSIPDYRMVQWDGAIWSHQGPGVNNRATSHIWASAPDDVYAGCWNGGGRLYWWNGAIWQEDISIPLNHFVQAMYGVDASEIYFWKNEAPKGVYKGTFGAWVLDFPGGAQECWHLAGNGLWCSPCGDVYLLIEDANCANAYVYRKPVGGVWALSYTCVQPLWSGCGGIYGISDTDVLACFWNRIARWDGSTWHEYIPEAILGVPPGAFGVLRGVWGVLAASMLNPSYEIAGVADGQAHDWVENQSTGAEEIAIFSGKPWEEFEQGFSSNEDSQSLFALTDLQLALFELATQPYESFDHSWGRNEWSQGFFNIADLDFAIFGADAFEDFEDGFFSNETSQDTFAPADVQLAVFDPAPQNFEDFESDWSLNENSAAMPVVAYVFYDVGVPEAVEDFEEEWTSDLGL